MVRALMNVAINHKLQPMILPPLFRAFVVVVLGAVGAQSWRHVTSKSVRSRSCCRKSFGLNAEAIVCLLCAQNTRNKGREQSRVRGAVAKG